MISGAASVFADTVTSWATQFGKEAIKVDPPPVIFEDGISNGSTFISGFRRPMLDGIRRASVRIVIVLVYTSDLYHIIQCANDERHSMVGAAGWSWISDGGISGMYSYMIRQTFSRNEATKALTGWLYLVERQPPEATMVSFHDKVKDYGRKKFGLEVSTVSPYAARLYDAGMQACRHVGCPAGPSNAGTPIDAHTHAHARWLSKQSSCTRTLQHVCLTQPALLRMAAQSSKQ